MSEPDFVQRQIRTLPKKEKVGADKLQEKKQNVKQDMDEKKGNLFETIKMKDNQFDSLFHLDRKWP